GSSAKAEKVIRRGDLSIDLDRRIVCRDGAELHLTRKEHEVLGLLARHVGRVVTHERILAACWGAGEEARVEYLRIVIRNLRQKLETPAP
ncbi:winged helix-turn-helix domain-containing protein, partial [Campylobacter jejuni]